MDPSDVLSMTLGLGGSLELDAHLCDLEAVGLVAPSDGEHRLSDSESSGDGPLPVPDAEDPRLALDRFARERFEKLERGVRRRLRALPEGRSRLPDATRFHADLISREALTRRGARAVAGVAREQCESYLLALTNLLDRVRAEARTLRSEVGPLLADLGPRAAELEALDALLARSSALFVGQLIARIPLSLDADFGHRAAVAVRALPDSPEPSDLLPWYAAEGFVEDLQRIAASVIDAVIAHERQALFGLIEAACETDRQAIEGSRHRVR